MQSSHYHIARLIKRGGMAEVHAAWVVGDDRHQEVALKRILPEHGDDEAFRASFLDEARIASQLKHPNIVAVHDFGILDGSPFLTMDLVDGVDLAALIALSAEAKQPIPPEIALAVGVAIGRALAYAHAAKDRQGQSLDLVHRDVTPENILVAWIGDVKLADFGIARAKDRLHATQIGVVKGKLGYMAPEQLDGSTVDGRTDLFALGCVLHEMLAGRSPIGSDRAKIDLDPSIPKDVLAIVKRATQPRREMRYASAAETAAECESALWSRIDRADPRRIVAAWAENHRARAEVRQTAGVLEPAPKLKDLFDLDLLLVSEADEPVRRFSSVAHTPINEAPPTQETEVVGMRRAERALDEAEVADIMRVLSIDRAVESSPAIVVTSAIVSASTSDHSAESSPTGPSVLEQDTIRERPDKGADDYLGQVLHGFRIVERIGGGISAAVYRAKHTVLQRECAVKVLVERYAKEEAAQRRLKREAEMLSGIVHPNVVSVVDFGSTPDGLPFLMTELLRGPTLQKVIEKGAPLDLERAAEIMRQIASGLAEAHRHGIVHRDLKPANIMLVDRPELDTVKILDFGMLRILRATGEVTKLTTTGFLLGTPAYAAPEQIISPSTADAAADLYALGVIAFEMLNARRPFVGSVYEVLSSHLNEPPPRAGDLDGLERIVEALLAKDPARRPTAAEVLDMLDARAKAQITRPPAAESPLSGRRRDEGSGSSRPARPAIPRAAPWTTGSWAVLLASGLVIGIAGASTLAYLRAPPAETIDVAPPTIEASPPPAVVARPADVPDEDEQAPSQPGPTANEPKHPRASRSSPARMRAPASDRATAPAPVSRDDGSPDLVVGKLRRISALLATSTDRLTASELDAFEDRYFALRSEARPPLDPDRAKALAPKVIALEADLEKRLER
jgi:serine/threonine-protein kinase